MNKLFFRITSWFGWFGKYMDETINFYREFNKSFSELRSDLLKKHHERNWTAAPWMPNGSEPGGEIEVLEEENPVISSLKKQILQPFPWPNLSQSYNEPDGFKGLEYYGNIINTGNNYQRKASRTLINKPEFELTDKDIMLTWNALGLTGEAGEVADEIKKGIFHQHGIDKEKLKKELGDCLWYIAAICTKMEFELNEIMELNIAKLKKRYPEGFSSEASINRKDK